MTSSLNSSVSATDTSYRDLVHVLRKRITFTDIAAKTIGVLPAGASIVSAGVHVVTAFNAGTNNDVDIGDSTTGDLFATNLSVAAVGYIVADELAATTNTVSTSDRTITAIYQPTGDASSAGVGDVIVLYVLA